MLAWNWDDNTDKHYFVVKRDKDLEYVGAQLELEDRPELRVGETKVLLPSPTDLVSFRLGNKPVLTYSQFGNDSAGYFSLTFTLTVPMPKTLIEHGDFDASLTIAVLTDSEHPFGGTYSKQENPKLEFNGFDKVEKVKILDPKLVRGMWMMEAVIAARTLISETWPLPHIILTWNTESIGGTSVTAKIDLDVVVDIALAGLVTKLSLVALR